MSDILSIVNLVILIVGFFLLRFYLPSYFKEKGKNLATKEDINVITDKVENIRSQYISNIERLKSSLEDEARRVEKRRSIYEEITDSLRVFISGHFSETTQLKEQFLISYAKAWLWASDEVLKTLNVFISLLIERKQNNVNQDGIKKAYVNCVLAMRKDVGFFDTKIGKEDYKFIRFDL